MSNCYFCGNSFGENIYKTTLCPSCGKEMKICMNCRHYDPAAHHACAEPQAEFVQEKLRANFCDYFTPGGGRRAGGRAKEEDARRKFEDLFS